MPVHILPFDPPLAGPPEWQAFNALLNDRQRQVFPADPPTPLEVQRRLWSLPVPEMRRLIWLAVDDQAPAGLAILELEDLPENRHMAFGQLYVAPACRRQGLGRRLLGCLAGPLQAEGRRTLLGAVEDVCPAGLAFVRRLGGAVGLEMQVCQLDLAQVDRALLDAWRKRPDSLPGDIELVFLGAPYPDSELPRLCRMVAAMNDAPRGSLDLADHLPTPQLLRQSDQFYLQRGVERWTVAARCLSGGEYVGYTVITLSPEHPQVAQQGSTSVRRDQRGHGLGRSLKAEMALKLLAERPQVRYIRTQNAGVNAPMRKINHELGFRPHHTHLLVQAPLDALLKYLAAES